MKRPQRVPRYWVERSFSFGLEQAAFYAANPRATIRSGGRGTEKNPKRLAQGRVGECAAALYFSLDPDFALKWEMIADDGHDLQLPNGLLADVKTTFPHYNLIWSNAVNDLYVQKNFHVLISVSIEENHFCNCFIDGFIDKMAFYVMRRIADGIERPKLEPGTWWLPKRELYDIEELKLWSVHKT